MDVLDDQKIKENIAAIDEAADADKQMKEIKEAAGLSSKYRKNIYVCREENCRHHIVTRDLHEGVTPMFISCVTPGCNGSMNSSMYRVWDESMKASHEWYKPTAIEVLSDGERSHVEQGGLLIRRIDRNSNP